MYKGKGDATDLNNQRNIHVKSYLPKAFETGVVNKSKTKIVEKCSKFQIGALPGHRPQEHLFVLKSTISLYTYLDIRISHPFYPDMRVCYVLAIYDIMQSKREY